MIDRLEAHGEKKEKVSEAKRIANLTEASLADTLEFLDPQSIDTIQRLIELGKNPWKGLWPWGWTYPTFIGLRADYYAEIWRELWQILSYVFLFNSYLHDIHEKYRKIITKKYVEIMAKLNITNTIKQFQDIVSELQILNRALLHREYFEMFEDCTEIRVDWIEDHIDNTIEVGWYFSFQTHREGGQKILSLQLVKTDEGNEYSISLRRALWYKWDDLWWWWHLHPNEWSIAFPSLADLNPLGSLDFARGNHIILCKKWSRLFFSPVFAELLSPELQAKVKIHDYESRSQVISNKPEIEWFYKGYKFAYIEL